MKKYLQLFLITFFLIGFLNTAKAQSTGDYRTRAAGAWNSTTVWQVYQLFIGWTNTTTNPMTTNGAISILHAVTISGGLAVNADQISISTGGSLTISDGTLNLFNGSGTDLALIGGTFTFNNSLSNLTAPSGTASISATSGTMNFSNGIIGTGVTISTFNATAVNFTQTASSNLTLNGNFYHYSSNGVWSAATATFNFGTNGFLYIGIGGVLNITGSGNNNLGSNSATSRSGIFTNLGTITKSTPSTLNINCSSYDDDGLFQLTTVASSVYVNSGGDIFGTMNASIAGSNFFYVTAAKNFYSGLTLSGAGAHHFNIASTFVISGTAAFNFSSTINLNHAILLVAIFTGLVP
jgi:hypothetical protein